MNRRIEITHPVGEIGHFLSVLRKTDHVHPDRFRAEPVYIILERITIGVPRDLIKLYGIVFTLNHRVGQFYIDPVLHNKRRIIPAVLILMAFGFAADVDRAPWFIVSRIIPADDDIVRWIHGTFHIGGCVIDNIVFCPLMYPIGDDMSVADVQHHDVIGYGGDTHQIPAGSPNKRIYKINQPAAIRTQAAA